MRQYHPRTVSVALTGLVALAAPVAVAVDPAHAGGFQDPVVGNVVGDDRPDTVVLTSTARGSTQCQARVTPGGRGRTVTLTYLVLPAGQPCPDLGTAVDVDGGGYDELVVSWFAGAPPAAPDELLTLRDFRLLAASDGLHQPSWLDHADFDGDRRVDVYGWTDQGDGFATFLSRGDGTFRPGPERWCANPRGVRLRDFDHDDAQDALLSYVEQCADQSSGVVVVLDDGSSRRLQHDPDGMRTWSASVVHLGGDRWPDVRTVEDGSGEVAYFVNDGSGGFVRVPRAVPDRVTVPAGRPTVIPVLANDQVGPGVTVTVTEPPRYGRVRPAPGGALVYTPAARPVAGDRFVYQVAEGSRRSRAAVTVRVTAAR